MGLPVKKKQKAQKDVFKLCISVDHSPFTVSLQTEMKGWAYSFFKSLFKIKIKNDAVLSPTDCYQTTGVHVLWLLIKVYTRQYGEKPLRQLLLYYKFSEVSCLNILYELVINQIYTMFAHILKTEIWSFDNATFKMFVFFSGHIRVNRGNNGCISQLVHKSENSVSSNLMDPFRPYLLQ